MQVKIHGNGKELFGDGLALWYVKDRMEEGPVFGSKDYFSGLAIFIDTYSNHNGEHNVSIYYFARGFYADLVLFCNGFLWSSFLVTASASLCVLHD